MSGVLREFEFFGRLMGCDFHVAIVTDAEQKARDAYEAMKMLGLFYEETFSRFIEDSELSKINRGDVHNVSQLFGDALRIAERLNHDTNGHINPLFQVRQLGYGTTFETVAQGTSTDAMPYNTDWSQVMFDSDAETIVLAPTQMIDFGGFIKGHAAEQIARCVRDMHGIVVNIGGDIYTRGLDEYGNPFVFSVYDPVSESYPVEIAVRDAALATSGTYKRTWKNNGLQVHHIMSGMHVCATTDTVSATIVHSEGAIADAYAKVAIILGSEQGIQFLAHQNIQYVIILHDGRVIQSIL